jgi:hypothetical protein
MKISQITEAKVPPELLAPRYFHGCKSELGAKNILKYGLQPPDFVADGRTKNYALRPVQGRVYMSPNANEAGKYGKYLFVINRNQLVNDLLPDEDEIGAIYHWISQKNFNDIEYYNNIFKDNSPELLARFDILRSPENVGKTSYFKSFMDRTLSPNTRHQILSGEYAWWAKGGKTALKKMPESIMNWLISIGVHVAHEGPIMPAEAWLIQKPGLLPDGSNLSDVAKRLNFSKNATLKVPKKKLYVFQIEFQTAWKDKKAKPRTETINAPSEKIAMQIFKDRVMGNYTKGVTFDIIRVTPMGEFTR